MLHHAALTMRPSVTPFGIVLVMKYLGCAGKSLPSGSAHVHLLYNTFLSL